MAFLGWRVSNKSAEYWPALPSENAPQLVLTFAEQLAEKRSPLLRLFRRQPFLPISSFTAGFQLVGCPTEQSIALEFHDQPREVLGEIGVMLVRDEGRFEELRAECLGGDEALPNAELLKLVAERGESSWWTCCARV